MFQNNEHEIVAEDFCNAAYFINQLWNKLTVNKATNIKKMQMDINTLWVLPVP